ENLVKNVADWTAAHGEYRSLPLTMQAPLFDSIELSAVDSFNLFIAIGAVAFALLALVHMRRQLAILPKSWLGRGQLLYFMILWPLVLGNFAKALTGFT